MSSENQKDRKEYYKNYQKYYYKKTRKMVTFALLNEEHNILKALADKTGVTPNALAKTITLNYLNKLPNSFQTTEQKKLIQEYMRISRGIATNINQIAYRTNLGDMVDMNILINSLKKYEDEFKKLLEKVL